MKISQSSVSPKLKPKQKFYVAKQILHTYFKVFHLIFFLSWARAEVENPNAN